MLRRTVELGVNFIDTADAYGPKVSEELIAEALHLYPDDLVFATKGGLVQPRAGDDPCGRRPRSTAGLQPARAPDAGRLRARMRSRRGERKGPLASRGERGRALTVARAQKIGGLHVVSFRAHRDPSPCSGGPNYPRACAAKLPATNNTSVAGEGLPVHH
jgi:hypothetical protein